MILFFFLLLMLAMAWGVVDHLQSMISNAPPPQPAPVTLAQPHRQAPAIVPSIIAPAPGKEADEDPADHAVAPGAATQAPSAWEKAVHQPGEKR